MVKWSVWQENPEQRVVKVVSDAFFVQLTSSSHPNLFPAVLKACINNTTGAPLNVNICQEALIP